MCFIFRRLFKVSASLLMLVLCGCSKGDGTLPLAGKVEFDGQPIVYGEIFFTPDSTKGHAGPQGYALIEKGTYNTSRSGKGVLPGPHIIRVSAYNEVPSSPAADDSVVSEPVPLFSGYELDAQLEDSSQDFTLPKEILGYGVEKKITQKNRKR